MEIVLVFAITLLLAVLFSGLASRSVMSTAVLFLAAGFLAGTDVFSLINLSPQNPSIETVVELTLFAVLFTDGMRLGLHDLTSAWKLPGRALLLGMPLTLLITSVMAHIVVGLPWPNALLVGTILSPTDPVFAAAIVGRKEIPARIRHMLNVESGLNDGLALPLVLAIIAVLGPSEPHITVWITELVLGIVLGVAIPWTVIKLERSRFFAATAIYEPLLAFSIGVLLYAVGNLLHANLFLAAFAGGITVATVGQPVRAAFNEFGEIVIELLKLGALLIFGAMLSIENFFEMGAAEVVFAGLVLILARPLALSIALFGSGLSWREWLVTAWFGPKGFASVVYGLLVLSSEIPQAEAIFHLVATVIVGSIIAHSSTDVLIARWFRASEEEKQASKASEPQPRLKEDLNEPA